jgi:cytosine deaminase
MIPQIPPTARYVLANARLPLALAATPPWPGATDPFADCDMEIAGGRVAAISPAGTLTATPDRPSVDLRRGLVLPRFVDAHTHLDKGHIWARSPNPDGTFLGARTTVMADREAWWHAEDVRARMEFALKCAFAHGTAAIRTHLDTIGKQTAITWPVLADLREAWKGRIEIQAVALFPTELAIDDEPQLRDIVATVARHGGALGGLTFLGHRPGEKLDRALDRVFEAASAHGLDLDFHVDESDSPDAVTFEAIALAALRNRFKGSIVAGHCCSLALHDDHQRRRVIDRVGEAGIAVVSLPMVNMYLQDRDRDRTPRWRGVAPLHELAAAGIPVTVASDNTRDPFHAYGDLDMLEVFREATRVLHLDHTDTPWERMLAPASAGIIGSTTSGSIAVGGPADLVLISARDFYELNCRPQADRVVLVRGAPIDRALPDYRELDRLQA